MSTNVSSSPEPTLPEKDRRVSPWWRALAYVLAIVLGLAIASAMSMYEQFKAQMEHMQKQLQAVSQIKSIAVLTDAQHAPAILITQDPQEFTLQLQRLNAVAEGQEDSMQLWALSGNARAQVIGCVVCQSQNAAPQRQ